MQEIQQSADILIEEKKPINSGSAQLGLNSFNIESKTIQSDLNLLITSDTGKPINKALISIDSAGMTAVSDQYGRVCIKEFPLGRFSLDVISCGFIAKTMLVSTNRFDSQGIWVSLTSNIG